MIGLIKLKENPVCIGTTQVISAGAEVQQYDTCAAQAEAAIL